MHHASVPQAHAIKAQQMHVEHVEQFSSDSRPAEMISAHAGSSKYRFYIINSQLNYTML